MKCEVMVHIEYLNVLKCMQVDLHIIFLKRRYKLNGRIHYILVVNTDNLEKQTVMWILSRT